MQPEKLILHPWQEIVGTMNKVETHEEKGVLRISLTRHFSLEIPINELIEGSVNLAQLEGQKVSVLRTNEAYILKLSEQDDDTKSKLLED